jgi:hypothetical protein
MMPGISKCFTRQRFSRERRTMRKSLANIANAGPTRRRTDFSPFLCFGLAELRGNGLKSVLRKRTLKRFWFRCSV